MKKIIFLFLAASFYISCSNKIYNTSGWQTKKVTIDGKLSEWSNPLRFYDQETGISYNITNDHNNLYFVCSISNDFLQTKILRSGLEFLIDTLGKKSFNVGIKYPIGNVSVTDIKPDYQQTKDRQGERPDRSAYKLKLLAQATEIQLTGFKQHLGKIIPLSAINNSGIFAAIDFDKNGIMNYEAVIPFSAFYRDNLVPSDSNRIFNFQIKINPVPGSNSGSGNGEGSRGGGMRGGGMGGGGMRGGGMGGGGNSYQRNSNTSGTTKTTIQLKLAYK